jgi:molybdenum cofactor cytidylyltransferase
VIGGIVLAAGSGSRFGGGKQLAQLDGRPLLEYALAAMASAPVCRTVVVLGSCADEVVGSVGLHGAEPVVCDSWSDGLAASLACGLAAMEDAEAVVVTLGDQPRVSPDAIRRVLAARGSAPAVRATYGGQPGHPVLIERRLFDRLRDATGDHGVRNVLQSMGVFEVPCDDLGGGEDVDTRGQLEAVRAAVSKPSPPAWR